MLFQRMNQKPWKSLFPFNNAFKYRVDIEHISNFTSNSTSALKVLAMIQQHIPIQQNT